MSTRRLLVVDLLLLAASLPGLFNVLAKDHVSTAEGVIAWISAVVFVGSLLVLLLLVARTVRRSLTTRA